MEDLGAWVTDILNGIAKAKLDPIARRDELRRALKDADTDQRKALRERIRMNADAERRKVPIVKRIANSPDEILEQERRARYWEDMLQVAEEYV
jgi:hypothetical protein